MDSVTMTVSALVTDRDSLPVAYEVAGLPQANPAAVQVSGPQPLVAQVSQVQATISVQNGTATIKAIRPLQAVDATGKVVAGVTVEPAEAQITLPISRRSDARDVGVRAVTEGTPPEGYWMSSLTAVPASVTLLGAPDALASISSFVDATPIDVSRAAGDLSVQAPLNLPPGITAVDSVGAPVQTVTVTAYIAARTGDMLITRPIELVGAREDVVTAVTPLAVEVLLSGPLPTLKEIEANPDLVQILVDVTRLIPIEGQSYEETPQITAPEGVRVQLTPMTVLVSLTREEPEG